jgi:hypothetical protein
MMIEKGKEVKAYSGTSHGDSVGMDASILTLQFRRTRTVELSAPRSGRKGQG